MRIPLIDLVGDTFFYSGTAYRRSDGRTHLHANGQVVFLDGLIVQRMIDLYVGPCETVIGPLLQVERVKLVGLRRGAGHQPIEDGRVTVNARAAKKWVCVTHGGIELGSADVEVGVVMEAVAACDKVEFFWIKKIFSHSNRQLAIRFFRAEQGGTNFCKGKTIEIKLFVLSLETHARRFRMCVYIYVSIS